jgi:hypothetical protein
MKTIKKATATLLLAIFVFTLAPQIFVTAAEGAYTVLLEPTFVFDDVYSLTNDGTAILRQYDQSKNAIVNVEGEYLVQPGTYTFISWFCDDVAVVEKQQTLGKSQWGVVDTNGKLLFPLTSEYDKIDSFNSGVAIVHSGDYNGAIDKTGKLVIPLTTDYKLSEFEYGISKINKDGKYGAVDVTGKIVVPIGTYDDFFDIIGPGLLCIRKGLEYALVDSAGNVIVPFGTYDRYFPLSYDGTIFVWKQYFKEIPIDPAENEGWDTKYDHDTEYAKIDVTGKVIIPLNSDYEFVSFRYIPIRSLDQHIDTNNDGYEDTWQYGLVDSSEKIIVPVGIYDNFRLFNNDKFAWVTKDGKWGAISFTIATSTTKPVIVDGKSVEFDAYAINGNTYYQLADIAYILNGSAKQFDAKWNSGLGGIDIISGTAYTGTAAFSPKLENAVFVASPLTSKIYLNGKQYDLKGYTWNGHTYYQLKDVSKALDFYTGWQDGTVIDTSKGYNTDLG